MAFPTIPTVAAGRVLTVNQLNTTATRTFPSLTGLTKNAGDLLIAVIVCYQSSVTDSAFSGWTGGFTEFSDTGAPTTLAIGMAYKWSTGSETGTFAVTQAATITGDAAMIVMSIPGAHASTIPEAGGRGNGTTALANPASFNPAGWDVEDTLWINVLGCGLTNITGTWTGTGATAPTNFTDLVRTSAADTSVVGDVEAAVSFRQNAAAAEDTGTAAAVDISNARNSAMTIAVRPAPAPSQGSVTGAIDWSGSATGTRVSSGAATGSIAWVGSATGTTQRRAAATGSIAWVGSSTGVRVPKGAVTGAIAWVGSADGEAPADVMDGAATGTITWAGSATGTNVRSGAATGAIGWVGSATGVSGRRGSATGFVSWVGGTTGSRTSSAVVTGAVTYVGVTTGESPAVGVQEGSAEGTITWAGTVTGTADREGGTTGTVTWNGTVDGRSYMEGSAVGTVSWSGVVTGRQPSTLFYDVSAGGGVRDRVSAGSGVVNRIEGGDRGYPTIVEGG